MARSLRANSAGFLMDVTSTVGGRGLFLKKCPFFFNYLTYCNISNPSKKIIYVAKITSCRTKSISSPNSEQFLQDNEKSKNCYNYPVSPLLFEHYKLCNQKNSSPSERTKEQETFTVVYQFTVKLTNQTARGYVYKFYRFFVIFKIYFTALWTIGFS